MMTKMLFLERRPHPESISVGGSGHFVVRRSTNLYLLNTNSAIAHKPAVAVAHVKMARCNCNFNHYVLSSFRRYVDCQFWPEPRACLCESSEAQNGNLWNGTRGTGYQGTPGYLGYRVPGYPRVPRVPGYMYQGTRVPVGGRNKKPLDHFQVVTLTGAATAWTRRFNKYMEGPHTECRNFPPRVLTGSSYAETYPGAPGTRVPPGAYTGTTTTTPTILKDGYLYPGRHALMSTRVPGYPGVPGVPGCSRVGPGYQGTRVPGVNTGYLGNYPGTGNQGIFIPTRVHVCPGNLAG
eukprot:543781-Rhodomonas_salina.4